MVTNLSIQNYALIDKLDVGFSPGLSIITGETGAGKSILVGASSLLLGDRADTSVLQDKSRKCIVEGSFDISGYDFKDIFKNADIDYENPTIIRREINAQGKSRAFINDTPVALVTLREFGTRLVDIHSQHEKLLLHNPGFHLEVVDAFARHKPLLSHYRKKYDLLKAEENILRALEEKELLARTDFDLLKFQLNELEEAGLNDGEMEVLEEELNTLNHSEEIKSALNSILEWLSSADEGALHQISRAKNQLAPLAVYQKALATLNDRLQSACIEVQDIIYELEKIEREATSDPERLEEVTIRIDRINHLLHKHRLASVNDLLKLKDSFTNRIGGTETLENDITEKRERLKKLKTELAISAGEMSKNRTKVFGRLEKEIGGMLVKMAMKDAAVSISHTTLPELGPTGVDKIEFLFKANKGRGFHEIGKTVSGGELSRVMLAIKSVLSGLAAYPTVIFDEIDSGVSGEVADKMGTLIKKMSAAIQVVAITHLPQIASKANAHFLAYKKVSGGITRSSIRLLSDEERVDEIARMLSGEQLTKAAVDNARELLQMN